MATINGVLWPPWPLAPSQLARFRDLNAVNPPNIAPTEGQAGEVPQIEPTFDWVRLPQRVPVRVRLTEIPDGIQLISGTTASVAVRPSAEE